MKSIESGQRTSQLGRRKILTFFGTDLTSAGESILKEACEAGYTLLPLDTAAIGQARKENIPFSLVEDWVKQDVYFQQRVEEYEGTISGWFRPAIGDFTSNGICWPVFDREAMEFFWFDMITANALAKSFNSYGVEELRCFLPKVPRPALYYYDSDVHTVFWKKMLPAKTRASELPMKSDDYKVFSNPSITFKSGIDGDLPTSLSIIENKIVLAVNPYEVLRFSPAIQDFSDRFPNSVAVVLSFPHLNMAKEISRNYLIPVICPIPSFSTAAEPGEQFLRGYRISRDSGAGKPWENYLRYVGYHFEYYCRGRWPALNATLEAWSKLWKEHCPRAVIVSILKDSESQLPSEAAKRRGIPTFSMPHSGGGISPNTVNSDWYLCSFPEQAVPIRERGIPDERIKSCRNMLAENEYTTVSRTNTIEATVCRLLAITGVVGFPRRIFPVISFKAQIRAIRAMANPPSDLATQVTLRIKQHPGFPGRGIFAIAGEELEKQVVPNDSELMSMLYETDLVIVVNCDTTATINAYRAGKPVIFFCTDPRLSKKVAAWLPGGLIANNGEELWSAVRSFVTDQAFAQELRSKSAEFARKKLDNSMNPSIGEVVDDILTTLPSRVPENFSKNRQPIQTCKITQLLPDYASIPVTLFDEIFDYGEIPLEELEVICKIVRNRQPRTVFELGTFMGRTTLCLSANSSARIYTLDLPSKSNENYVPPEMNDPEIEVYPENPGVKFCDTTYASRITQLYGDSQSFAFCPYFGKMDVVIVDACHHYDFVLRDSMNAFKMIKPDGIVIWYGYADNVPGVLKALGVVSQKFPLIHISGTSLVIYMGRQDVIVRPENHGNEGNSQMSTSQLVLNRLTAPTKMKSSGEMEQDDEKTPPEPLRVQYPDTSDSTVNIGLLDNADQQEKTHEYDPVRLSVIIPTFNRAEFLSQTIVSVLGQTISPSEYEIIVVDNNSTDNTKSVIENLNRKHGNRIRYIFEPESGLVYGRHTGAREAKGEILVFTDDDIIAPEGWIAAIKESFSDVGVSLVGGKNIPRYDAPPPEWIDAFWSKNELGVWNIYISLLDLGEKQIEIPANFVFGCNFSIRKDVLYKCGGFHPDVVPRELIRYLGDGEYGLALAFMKKGYKAVYNPAASIEHLVPKGRMTVEYFCRRAFGEGVTNSYTEIREKGSVLEETAHDPEIIHKANQFAEAIMYGTLNTDKATSTHEIQELVRYSRRQGVLYHQNQVRNDPDLLSYVLQKDYYTPDTPFVRSIEKIEKAQPAPRKFLDLEEKGLSTKEIISKRAVAFATGGKHSLDECLYQKALSDFDNAMYLYPDMKGLQYLRGVCLLYTGRVSEAEVAVKSELKVQPGFKPALSLQKSLGEA